MKYNILVVDDEKNIREGLAKLLEMEGHRVHVATDGRAGIAKAHGPGAIGFVGSPFATNEENYLLSKLARAAVGSNNIDTTTGPVMGAAASALRRAFGTEVLPADMTGLAQAKTVLVVADDLESSHNVACLRVKDAVVGNGARLIVVTPRWGELCDFAEVWLRPQPGSSNEPCRLSPFCH